MSNTGEPCIHCAAPIAGPDDHDPGCVYGEEQEQAKPERKQEHRLDRIENRCACGAEYIFDETLQVELCAARSEELLAARAEARKRGGPAYHELRKQQAQTARMNARHRKTIRRRRAPAPYYD